MKISQITYEQLGLRWHVWEMVEDGQALGKIEQRFEEDGTVFYGQLLRPDDLRPRIANRRPTGTGPQPSLQAAAERIMEMIRSPEFAWADARSDGFSMTNSGFREWVVLDRGCPIGYVQHGWKIGGWGGACRAGSVFQRTTHRDAAAALVWLYRAAGSPVPTERERHVMMDQIERERARRKAA